MALAVTGSAAAFAAGGPILAHSCGGPVALAPGTQRLQVLDGAFAVDDLALQSPAPVPVPAAARAPAGRVVNSGTSGHGTYDGIRVVIRHPGWLVLGEGYDHGWRAWCNGRSLGAPVPIDGYANGWHVSPGCTTVRLSFAPDRIAVAGYLISGVAGLLCLLVVVVAFRRRRRRRSGEMDPPAAPTRAPAAPAPPAAAAPAPPAAAAPAPAPEPVRPPFSPGDHAWSPRRALTWAIPAALAFGFVFGVRAGIVAFPVVAVVLWRGIGALALTLGAGALLGIAVPLLYLVAPSSSAGGNHYGYAADHMTAQWCAVAALGLLMVALWRSLQGARQ